MERADTISQEEMTMEQREHYRYQLLASLRAARRYDGRQESYRSLMETVQAFDQWMRDTFGGGQAIGAEKEKKIAREAGAKERTISDILDIAQRSFSTLLESPQTLEEVLANLRIVHAQIEGILLPPGQQDIPQGDGAGQWEKTKMEPRIQRLISALQQHGIFTDDLIVTSGITDPRMMRKESYVLIEIPRIGREVLVCNQIGEATFVSRKHYNLYTYCMNLHHSSNTPTNL